jgi:peptide/nickel transport system substrate-binding protein
VTFHDGSAFDARDVAATLRFILRPSNGSGYMRFVRSVDKAVVVDPHTVDLVSSVPNTLLPDYVNQIPMLSAGQLDGPKDDHATRLMGTGPYRLVRWKQGESVLVRRNAAYWGEQAKYAEVLLKAVPEPSTRLADIQSNNADVIADVLPEADQLIGQGATVKTEPAYMAFLERGAFAKRAVRQALYRAVDRQAIALPRRGGCSPSPR